MSRAENQVVIVGAGPVGLMAAYRLSEFGIGCTVLEAGDDVADELRASTFHPPTLDKLDEYGLGQALVAQGRICPKWQIRVHETHQRLEFDLSLLEGDTKHPYRLQCEQVKLSRLLLERLRKASHVTLLFGHTVESVEQDDDGVTVRAVAGDRAVTVGGRFLIGADGARSVVRGQLEMPFNGRTYPETTILATTTFRFEDHLPDVANVAYVWTRQGTFSLLHLPTVWRCSLYPDVDESIEEGLTPESIERKMQRIAPREGGHEVLEIRPYRVHMRIVDDFRRGRIILAGDAAHINSPSGGMGMNGGIHDAYNLTDKLRRIWQGESTDLLDRYTRQRRSVAAEEILQQADQNRARMQERDLEKRQALFANLKRVVDNKDLHRAHLLRSSMIEGLRKSEALA
jgi:2-polyprenyl-6-methoxyphenol hydroxylase-like FAD-dependent oxidoreductase